MSWGTPSARFDSGRHQAGLTYDSYGSVVPDYLISDDYSSLIPDFNTKKKAIFKLAADKQGATVTQTIEEDYGGDIYRTTYKATL